MDVLKMKVEKLDNGLYQFEVDRKSDNPMDNFSFGVTGPKGDAIAEVSHYLFLFTRDEEERNKGKDDYVNQCKAD